MHEMSLSYKKYDYSRYALITARAPRCYFRRQLDRQGSFRSEAGVPASDFDALRFYSRRLGAASPRLRPGWPRLHFATAGAHQAALTAMRQLRLSVGRPTAAK